MITRARLIGGMPADLVGSLTGLTQGRFPLAATSRYADQHHHSTDIFARPGAAVVAVQDGTVVRTVDPDATAKRGRWSGPTG